MRTFYISFVLTLGILILSDAPVVAQQRFKAGLIAGFNAAQIDGDYSAGFNKIGLVAGIRGVTVFSPHIELSTEILYSQRGSRSKTSETDYIFGEPMKIQLNYVEVPVIFNYLDWKSSKGDDEFYRTHFYFGLSYGRLISGSVNDIAKSFILRDFDSLSKNDLSLIAGVSFYFTKHLGLSLRYTRSLVSIQSFQDQGFNNVRLWGYFLSMQALYMF